MLNTRVCIRLTDRTLVVDLLPSRCDSLVKLKQKLPELRKEIDDPPKFKAIYEFAFMWSRESSEKKVLGERHLSFPARKGADLLLLYQIWRRPKI